MRTEALEVRAGDVALQGDLARHDLGRGLVVFAHGSGSSRHSPRNQQVAAVLQGAGFATLLFDLLTVQEEDVDAQTGHLRFDIPLLADRLGAVVSWMRAEYAVARGPVGMFGASTGAAAALVAAAQLPDDVGAVVSRGGRPDLAEPTLPEVRAPTLLIVGGRDLDVLSLNERAAARLTCPTEVHVVPGAGHLFAEPGTLDEVAHHATRWFERHLPPG